MKLFNVILFFCLYLTQVFGSEGISYSGRLVTSSGAPISGPVDLRFSIIVNDGSSDSTSCALVINNANLSNGVFNVEFDFGTACVGGTKSLSEVLSDVQKNNHTVYLQVEDLTNAKIYSKQKIQSTPKALIANKVVEGSIDHLSFKGIAAVCGANKVLKTTVNGGFICDDYIASAGGSVTSVSADANGALTVSGTATDPVFAVNVDNTTLEISSNALQLKPGSIGSIIMTNSSGVPAWTMFGTCPAGSSIRAINNDGTVICEGDDNTILSAGSGIDTLSLAGGTIMIANDSVDSSMIADASIVDGDISASANIAQSKISNLTTDLANKIPSSALSTDSNLGTSDSIIPSQNAIKTYVDARASQWGTNLTDIYYGVGKVGVGTTSPARLLHVNEDSNNQAMIRIESDRDGLGASTAVLELMAPSSPAPANKKHFQIMNVNGSSENYVAITSNDDAMGSASKILNITHSGKVGINNTIPSEALDVTGKVKASELCIGSDCRAVWPSAGGSGTVTSVTGGTGLTGGTITSSGTLAVDVGTTAGKIVQLNGAGKLATSIETDPTVQGFAKSVLPTCGVGQVLKSDGTNFSCVTDIDTDTNTTYSAGTGLDLTGTTLSVANGGISNSHINAAAAIDQSKINGLTTDLAAKMPLSYLSTNTALGASDVLVPSQNAVKNYVDARASQWVNSGANIYFDTGKVSIGTPTIGASEHFRVNAPANSYTATFSSPNDTWMAVEFENTSSGATWESAVSGSTSHAGMPAGSYYIWEQNNIGSGTGARVVVEPGGNVGIGVPNPTEKLDVGGKVKGTELCIGVDCRSSWPSAGGSGTVTSVATGTGLTGGPITATGTIAVDVGTGAGKIVQLDGSGKLATSVETDPTVQAFAKSVLPTCNAGEVLKSNGTNFSCVTDLDTDTNTTYSASTGLNLTGTSFSVAAQGILDTNLSGLSSSCGNGQILLTNGLGSFYCGDRHWNDNSGDLFFNTGSVAIGGTTPNASSLLDLQSTTKGFLPPRMTTAQRDAIASPSEGLIIFNTTTSKLDFYDGSSWKSMFGKANFIKLGMSAYQTVDNGSVINFNTVRSSNGMTFTGNSINLKAGVTYRIEAAVSTIATTGAGYLGYYLRTPSGTIGSEAYTSSPVGTGNYGFKGQIFEIYTPAVDETIWLQVGDDNIGTGQISNNYNTYFAATELNVSYSTSGGSLTTDSVTANEIADNSVTSSEISDGTITSTDIASNTITVDNVDFASSNGINIPQQASDPVSGTAGQIYFNTTTKKMMMYDGTSWVDLSTATGGSGDAIGAPSDITLNTVVQASQDGLLVVIPGGGGTHSYHEVRVDTVNPPVALRGWGKAYHSGGTMATSTVPIRKNEYFKVVNTYGNDPSLIRFFPLSGGSSSIVDSNGVKIPQLASDPSSPVAGQVYFNTTSNKMMVYNGSSWEEVGASSGGSIHTQSVEQASSISLANTVWTDVLSVVVGKTSKFNIFAGGTGQTSASWSYFAFHCKLYKNAEILQDSPFYYGGGQSGSTAFVPQRLYSLSDLSSGDVIKVACMRSSDVASSTSGWKITLVEAVGGSSLGDTNGVKIPQLASAPSSPVVGQMYYNTSSSLTMVYDGTTWQSLGNSIPAGAIMAFDASSCPAGWSEYTPAQGRFLRGIDKTGTNIDPAGQRAAGHIQNFDWVGFSMTNTLQNVNSGYSHGPVDMGKSTSTYVGNLFAGGWNNPSAASGVRWNAADEIRPKNVAVLYCSFNGVSAPQSAGSNQLKVGDTSVEMTDNGSDGTISMKVDGSEALHISNDGKVGIGTSSPSAKLQVVGGNIQAPDQVSFEAKNCSGSVSSGSVLVWETVNHNIGGHYNNATGVFTAPVAGVYQFGFNTLANNAGAGEYRYGFYKNGAPENLMITVKAANTWETVQGTLMTKLNAGDTIDIRYTMGTGVTYTDCNFNRFWGRLEN